MLIQAKELRALLQRTPPWRWAFVEAIENQTLLWAIELPLNHRKGSARLFLIR